MLSKVTLVLLLAGIYRADAYITGVDHDKIPPIADVLPADSYWRRWQPHLKVAEGCAPYPAVAGNGDYSLGLAPYGPLAGECSTPLENGQVYARLGSVGQKLAVMYAWYFPKFQDPAGDNSVGHYHSWHNVIIWTDSTNGAITDITPEVGGLYFHASLAPSRVGRPIILKTEGGLTYNNFEQTDDLQQIAVWNLLTDEAKNTLNTYNWITRHDTYDVHCPINNSNFQFNLEKGYQAIHPV